MSINTGPGSFAHAATRNLVWALDGYVSYKHTDIQAVKNVAENFTTQRELCSALPCAAVSTGGEVDAGTWAFMLAEKQRREASYKSGAGWTTGCPKTTRVGGESDLNRSQTGYELRLRTLRVTKSPVRPTIPQHGHDVASCCVKERLRTSWPRARSSRASPSRSTSSVQHRPDGAVLGRRTQGHGDMR